MRLPAYTFFTKVFLRFLFLSRSLTNIEMSVNISATASIIETTSSHTLVSLSVVVSVSSSSSVEEEPISTVTSVAE